MKNKIIFMSLFLGISLFVNTSIEARGHCTLSINLERPQVEARRVVETRIVETRVVETHHMAQPVYVREVYPVRQVLPVYAVPVQRTVIREVYQAPAQQPRSNFWFSLFLS